MDDFMIVDPQDEKSDYGSDFSAGEEEILNRLLKLSPPRPVLDLDTLVGDENALAATSLYHNRHGSQDRSSHLVQRRIERKSQISVEFETSSESRLRASYNPNATPAEDDDPASKVPDLRSPLERFRTKPKKPLSVSDLVSPSWCELQYWYVLTKQAGKRTKTWSMRQGSKVHKTLEHEVHRVVPVNVTTKEDHWGLRIWNIIQGLRTLRNGGMTRELEVWGVIDGQIVNGVIDELSYVCPDRELEASDPMVINDKTMPAADDSHGVLHNLPSSSKRTSRIYLTDVKTRSVQRVPHGASFRPTLIQLMLYHRLLSDLANNRTDPAILFDRYSLRPHDPFSDAFIAQIAAMVEGTTLDEETSETPKSSDEVFSTSSAEPKSSSMTTNQPDAVQLLLDHNSLHQLWTLMTDEIALTMPEGAASIGSVLKVEYRGQNDGAVIGTKAFLNDNDVLQSYLDDGMRWWKGEREARGVCVEEAYKCGFCEFAEDCDWRKNKIEEATEAHRARSRSVV